MPFVRRRREAAAVLALAASAALAGPGSGATARAAGEEGYGTEMVGQYAVELSSGEDVGLDLREASASVTARPAGRLGVPPAPLAAARGPAPTRPPPPAPGARPALPG